MRSLRRLAGRIAKRLGYRKRVAPRGPSEPLPAQPVSDDVSGLRLRTIEVLPYTGGDVAPIERLPIDEQRLHVYEREGKRVFHPVAQTQFALACLDMFAASGDRTYLDIAAINAQDIADRLVGDYLPYGFDFRLHGDPRNTIHATWFSGMAQGQYLSLVSRLARHLGDEPWVALGERMLSTLGEHHPFDALPDRPWVGLVDQDGLFWFEEYAGDVPPMRVLNGHLFALLGVFDFWAHTGRADAEALFAEAAQTALRAVPRLRSPGAASWYGLRIRDNPLAQSEKYHRIHITQLRHVAAMTGDERFTRLADELESDCPVAELPLPLMPMIPTY